MIDITGIKTLVTIEPLSVTNTSQNSTQTPNPLSSVTNGTFLDGFVVNRNAQNQPILRTSAGDVLVNTPLFIRTGTEVTIKVDNTQPNLARIITIDGKTPELFAEQVRANANATSSDSLSSQLASAVNNNSSTPKPVLLQGMILQLVARDSLPPSIADAVFRALGINKTMRSTSSNQPAIPLSILLQSITVPTVKMPEAQPISSNSGTPASTPTVLSQPPSSTDGVDIIQNIAKSPMQKTQTAEGKVKPEALRTQDTKLPITAETNKTIQNIAFDKNEANYTSQKTGIATNAFAPNNATPASTVKGNTNAQIIQQVAPQASSDAVLLAKTQNTNLTKPTANEPHVAINTDANQQAPVKQAIASTTSFAPIEIKDSQTVRLQGLVIGQEQQTDTILHTQMGSIRIFTPKPLPTGSLVTIEVTASAVQNALVNTNFESLETNHNIMRDWAVLSELLQDTQRQDATGFHGMMSKIIPSTGKNLTQSMMFFLSALKGGDFKQWMGGSKNIDALEAKYGDLLKKIASEFQTLQQAFTEPNQQNWVSTSIPIMHDNRLEQARLHIKQEAESEVSKNNTQGQRFVLDIELSRLGEMQLDGFIQKNEGKQQFDMVVRTSKPLPNDVEIGIRDIFTSATEITGFKGMILFQTSREQFVIIAPANTPKNEAGIIA